MIIVFHSETAPEMWEWQIIRDDGRIVECEHTYYNPIIAMTEALKEFSTPEQEDP